MHRSPGFNPPEKESSAHLHPLIVPPGRFTERRRAKERRSPSLFLQPYRGRDSTRTFDAHEIQNGNAIFWKGERAISRGWRDGASILSHCDLRIRSEEPFS